MVINGIYKHKRSSVAGKVPLTTDISVGEIAINTADELVYTKNASGAIIALNQSYSREEADSRYVPQGILPITRVGDLSDDPLPVAMSSGFTFTVTADIQVLLGGRHSIITAGNYTIANVDNGNTADLTNKTINVYISFSGGSSAFSYYTTAAPEAYTRVFIGTMTTTSAITSISLSKVSRLDLYRVSLTSRGSAIPVTSGNPAGPGTFDPSWSI